MLSISERTSMEKLERVSGGGGSLLGEFGGGGGLLEGVMHLEKEAVSLKVRALLEEI